MSARTPGPWSVGDGQIGRYVMSMMVYCDDSLGSRIADLSTHGAGITDAQAEANAAFIVEACNAYDRLTAQRDALKAALEDIVKETQFCGDSTAAMSEGLDDIMDTASAALATLTK